LSKAARTALLLTRRFRPSILGPLRYIRRNFCSFAEVGPRNLRSIRARFILRSSLCSSLAVAPLPVGRGDDDRTATLVLRTSPPARTLFS